MRGANQNNLDDAYDRVFPQVVNRAIQLESIGEFGVPLEHNFQRDFPAPEQIVRTREWMQGIRNSKITLNCSLNISMAHVDVKENWSVVGVLISSSPVRYAVVVPDSFDGTGFSSLASFSHLAGRAKPFVPGQAAPQDVSQLLPHGIDVSAEYEMLVSRYPKGFSMKKSECEEFGLIEFKEN